MSTNAPFDLLLFAHLVRKQECMLEHAALLVAATEYPDLDVAGYMAKLDALGRLARQRLAVSRRGAADQPGDQRSVRAMACVLDFLYREMGFHGNSADYYDPRNSFLNQVIDRRVGVPITLAIVLIAVARRAGLEAQGVSFPGHFLVRANVRGGASMFVDPFDGRMLDARGLRALYEQATGDLRGDIDARLLEPAGRSQIVCRMLNNLRAIYEVRGDRARLQRILERMAIVAPSDEVRTRLDLLVQTPELAPRVSVN